MQVILVGYMGSGKSTIGKRLAKKLNIDFIDLDTYISDKENAIVRDVFTKKGEIYFRKIESQYLKQLLKSNKSFVLAVGGGTPCYANNASLIAKNNYSFYLKNNINTLYKRLLVAKTERPLVSNIKDENLKEFIAKHLFERVPYYESAKHTIIADNKKEEDIVAEISSNIQQLL